MSIVVEVCCDGAKGKGDMGEKGKAHGWSWCRKTVKKMKAKTMKMEGERSR